jgi:hypothetical protein
VILKYGRSQKSQRLELGVEVCSVIRSPHAPQLPAGRIQKSCVTISGRSCTVSWKSGVSGGMIKSIHSQHAWPCQGLIPQAQVQLPRLVSEQIVASGFGTADSEIYSGSQVPMTQQKTAKRLSQVFGPGAAKIWVACKQWRRPMNWAWPPVFGQ